MDVLKRYLPNLGECWLLVALMFIGSIVAGVVIPDGPMSAQYAASLLLPFLYIFFLAPKKYRPVPLNAPSFGKLGGIGMFALSALAMLALMVAVEPTTEFIPMPDLIKDLFRKVFINTKLWDGVVSTCILAPLLEELLCRGVMMRGMLRHKSPAKAIFWSAFLFAVMHANPWQSIPALIFGIMFGWVYYRTGCLWLTIFLHCLNNSISTLIARLMPDADVDEGLMDLMGSGYWILFAASIVVLAVSIFIIYEKTVPVKIHSRSQGENMGVGAPSDI